MKKFLLTCVVDTSLVIDLYIGEILHEAFHLSYQFLAPDVIIEELQEPDGQWLIAKEKFPKRLGNKNAQITPLLTQSSALRIEPPAAPRMVLCPSMTNL